MQNAFRQKSTSSNRKEKRTFCEEYLVDLNATQAAVRAGYAEKNAGKIGHELLEKTRISEYLSELMKLQSERTGITADNVLKELEKVAFAETDISGNPDSPMHWFYQQWILQAEQKNALYIHFEMQDNPAMTPDKIRRTENLYFGVFYERYIKGRWVLADGLIYPMFDKSKHLAEPPEDFEKLSGGSFYISVDYGTLNPTSMGLWFLTPDGFAYRIRESYYDGRKALPRTDEEHYQELERLAGNFKDRIESVIVDPSAASFIECIRRHQLFPVRKAKNEVLDGIRNTAALLQAERLFFSPSCKDSIREFGLYCWDAKASEDKVLKENDHAMDDIRYFVHTVMRWQMPDLFFSP